MESQGSTRHRSHRIPSGTRAFLGEFRLEKALPRWEVRTGAITTLFPSPGQWERDGEVPAGKRSGSDNSPGAAGAAPQVFTESLGGFSAGH